MARTLAVGMDSAVRILALDLGRTTGWCLLDTEKNDWHWGNHGFGQNHWESFGASLMRFELWLLESVQNLLPELVAYEQVAHQKGQGAYVIDAQRAILMLVLEKLGIPYMAVNVQTLKAFGLTPEHRARMGVKGNAKKEHLRELLETEWGKRVGAGRFPKKRPTEDETDALWMAAYARTQVPERPVGRGG